MYYCPLDSTPEQMQDPVEFINSHLKEVSIPMQCNSVLDAIGEDYKQWRSRNPVFIDAPTGTGKTTFVYKKLIPHAISQGGTVFLVSNRIALSAQQKREIITLVNDLAPDTTFIHPDSEDLDIDNLSYIGPVCVTTYQGLYKRVNYALPEDFLPEAWFSRLTYAIFDEIHFLYSDALFNPFCGRLLQKIPMIFNRAVRVYMTATSWDIKSSIGYAECNFRSAQSSSLLTNREQYVANISGPQSPEKNPIRVFKYYNREADYSSYRLHFFGERRKIADSNESEDEEDEECPQYLRSLVNAMNPLPSKTNKWIIFINKKSHGTELKRLLKQKEKKARETGKEYTLSIAYIDAQKKKPQEVWKNLISKECFDESVLISTSVIDCGVNIQDENVKNIAVFSTDRTSFIQLIGRKRRKPDEKIDLWVWLPTKNAFLQQEKNFTKELILADKLLKAQDQMNTQEKYPEIARNIWDERKQLRTETLFFINNHGYFDVDKYVMSIIRQRLIFIHQFTRPRQPACFKDVVEEWLGITETVEDPNQNGQQDIDLPVLLEQNVGKQISEKDFAPIRQAIVDIAMANHIESVRADRKDSLSAKTLNRFLEKLGVPYTVAKEAKVWTITAI